MVTTDADELLSQKGFRKIFITHLKPPPKGKISSELEADFESK
jgi:hypothetical protein